MIRKWACLLLICSSYLPAETLIVDNVQDLKRRVRAAQCNDLIQLQPGNYANVKLDIKQPCSEQYPFKIAAKMPGSVHFTGQTRINIYGNFIELSGIDFRDGSRTEPEDLITVTGQDNTITNNRFTDIDRADGVWIQLNGQRNQVLHNEFTGKRSAGSYINIDVIADLPSEHRVAYNYFSRPPLGKNGGSAARIGHGSMHDKKARVIFEYNLFDQQNGESEIVAVKSSETVFRYNTFRNSKEYLSLRQGNNSLVYDNYFLGSGEPGQNGLFIRGKGHVVFNNYFQGQAPLVGQDDYGVVSLGSASDQPEPRRAERAVNPMHFPLTGNILLASNTIVNGATAGFAIGADYTPFDKGRRKKRTRPPESVYLINNLVINTAEAVKLTGNPTDIHAMANYSPGANEYNGFNADPLNLSHVSLLPGLEVIKPEAVTASAQPLPPWLKRVGLDISWQENRRLLARMADQPHIGFSVPVNRDGKVVRPLTRSDVGVRK